VEEYRTYAHGPNRRRLVGDDQRVDLSDAENALLSHIREARESRETTTTRAEESGVGAEGVYKVQAAMGEGRKVLGYKLGLIGPAKQAQMGVDSPMYGRVYEDMTLASPVNLSSMIQPRRPRGRVNDLFGFARRRGGRAGYDRVARSPRQRAGRGPARRLTRDL
jgi:hypothetical protein